MGILNYMCTALPKFSFPGPSLIHLNIVLTVLQVYNVSETLRNLEWLLFTVNQNNIYLRIFLLSVAREPGWCS